jgi:redox-sensitive bicupin YhaK (pirin superfamily)
MKSLVGLYHAPPGHWVGDGFPVRTLFSYSRLGQLLSPFLLFDYAGPMDFTAAARPRGVGEHPHRGFETVTLVYSGEVSHRDSAGGGGTIGPGDVQWMTAAAGLIHEEYHSPEYAQKGGPFEMVQLWVNLPTKDKMSTPGYQGITADQIPSATLADSAGQVRIIAGAYAGHHGPARTFTPMNVWDLRLKASHRVAFNLPDGYTTALFVLNGAIRLSDSHMVRSAELAVMERQGTQLIFDVVEDTRLLLLNGEPLNEPIVGHGPFVMNTKNEIIEAINDFNSGHFGQIKH